MDKDNVKLRALDFSLKNLGTLGTEDTNIENKNIINIAIVDSGKHLDKFKHLNSFLYPTRNLIAGC